mmetsp:Transcript_52163/g.122253  ORF Transcript_52163/g.122253 Transcript_52163/m.122253 type:complete len:206 (+) Transcript_52163:231-848(+)
MLREWWGAVSVEHEGLLLHVRWPRPRQHLDDGDPKAPHVGWEALLLAAYDLWGHPGEGAVEAGAVGDVGGVVEPLGETKVGKLDDAALGDEEVGRLDVAVDNLMSVEVFEAQETLVAEAAGDGDGESAKHFEDGVDAAARDKLHEEVELGEAALGAEVVDDVGVAMQVLEEDDLALQQRDLLACVLAVQGETLDGHHLARAVVQP